MNTEAANAPKDEQSDVVYVCVDERRFNQISADLDASRRVNARQALAMASAGHDLRQHLQTILMALDLIRPALSEGEPLRWLAVAREQVEALAGGLAELAVEANIGAYTDQRKRSSFPIAEVLARIEKKWLPAALAKKLHLKIDRSPLRVRSNADLLLTIIDNLVGNAVKHTNRGSIGVRLSVERNTLMISVQDTGPGICADSLECIFDPYWRGTDDHVGMGLGLAIVQSTASLLDHRISVNSRVGQGSCFTVHVPLATRSTEGLAQVSRDRPCTVPG
ncbi:MAG: HAMP domain-containing sensor histidine kinase [Dokdonella sp.]